MRGLGVRLAALAASALMALVLLECGVVALIGEQPKFPRHVVGAEFGVRVNEPGARYRHRSADVDVAFSINSRGLRDTREFAYEKPPGRSRIVSLGDSFTVGYEVEAEETFSQVLEARLRAAGHDVEVLNAGVSGYSNAEALLYLERELLRYAPDVVVLSFFGNDLVDNRRTGLFRLEEGELVPVAESYVPAGGLGNFLNTNPVFNWFSEHSNAFVLVKEKATHLVKRQMVARNVANLEAASGEAPAGDSGSPAGGSAPEKAGDAAEGDADARLAAALVERMYELARGAGAGFVVHSIPSPVPGVAPERLLELFPVELVDFTREGIAFVPSQPLLEPLRERELLYYTRSHGHWTPLAHRVAGEALAETIIARGWLPSGR